MSRDTFTRNYTDTAQLPLLLTVDDLAVLMRRPKEYVRRLCAEGFFENAQRIGGKWSIPKSSAVRRLGIS